MITHKEEIALHSSVYTKSFHNLQLYENECLIKNMLLLIVFHTVDQKTLKLIRF